MFHDPWFHNLSQKISTDGKKTWQSSIQSAVIFVLDDITRQTLRHWFGFEGNHVPNGWEQPAWVLVQPVALCHMSAPLSLSFLHCIYQIKLKKAQKNCLKKKKQHYRTWTWPTGATPGHNLITRHDVCITFPVFLLPIKLKHFCRLISLISVFLSYTDV